MDLQLNLLGIPYPNNRANSIRQMILEQKQQVLRGFGRNIENLFKNKKYRPYEQHLADKIQKSDTFIRNIADIFFEMITDRDFIELTTQGEITEKIYRLKKNIDCAWQKLTLGFDAEIECFEKKKAKMLSTPRNATLQENSQMPHESQEQQAEKVDQFKIKKKKQKSKNYKISNDTTVGMMKWLLQNFESPYPTFEEKQEMARQAGISLSKVNNWFINARERTVKSYFPKNP